MTTSANRTLFRNRLSRRRAIIGLTGLGLGGLVKMAMPDEGMDCSVGCCSGPLLESRPKMNDAYVAGLNQLGLDLFHKLSPKNLFLSPTSVGLALAMTEKGARGETRAQMRNILHMPTANESDVSGWRGIIDSLRAEKPGRQVRLANRLFGQKNYGFVADYTALLEKGFDAPLEEVDYEGDPEKARTRINLWVLEQTRNLIRDLVPVGALTPLTRLVLVNAIHFKGDWLSPFEKDSSRPAPFETGGGNSITVDRMNKVGRFVIRSTPEAESVELPCKGNDRSVHFILPKKRHTLASVEKQLTLAHWNTLLFSDSQFDQVALGLPKFKLESTEILNTALKGLGMSDAFGDQANFSGMNGGKEALRIDTVIHKSVLVVDEKGAEAAAATAIMMRATSAPNPMKPKVFLVDQPFLVAITDKTTKGILFLGRVVKPQSK